MKSFSAKIQHDPVRGGAWVEVPFDVKKEFGSLRPPVRVLFNDEVEYRGSLIRMGGSSHILGVKKDIRKKLGVEPGIEIDVKLELDTEPRLVEVPPALTAELNANPAIKKWFDKLSYSHRKEYVEYITEAKKEETRVRRAKKAITMMEKSKQQ